MSQQFIKRLQLLIASLMLMATPAFADFTVREVTGNVQIKQGGGTKDATVGMVIKPVDLIIIPENGSIKILDSRTSQIYESTTSGQVTATRIVFDASKKAASNSASINDKLRMGSDGRTGGVVYVEKGKVTRALRAYDPTAEQVQLDVDQLSRRLYAMLSDSTAMANDNDEPGVVVRHRRNERNGLSFMVENAMPFPIYFNVVKKEPGCKEIEISEIGQPVGSYALQPDQSMARDQKSGLDPECGHMLIVTNYYFDVDELLNKLNTLITSNTPVENDSAQFPLLIRQL